MNNLKEKLKKNGGFTMVELLIVVAIIGILAAVSIPMFNNALEKARHGVDAANARSAVSLANAQAIASLDPAKEFAGGKTYKYIVDESASGDHQAALVDKSSTAPGTNVMPKCTCTGATGTKAALQVKITYNAGAVSTDPLKMFVIETNWVFDDDGKIKEFKDLT